MASSSLFSTILAASLLSLLSLPPSSLACMIQGTDSGFCDYRYHPMYYSEVHPHNDPTEKLWLTEKLSKRKEYIKASELMWKNETEGPCSDGSGPHCLSFCGKYLFGHSNGDAGTHHNNFYVPCVPRDQSLPKDRNHPNGRFREHTVRKKDMWVADFLEYYIRDPEFGRLRIETLENNTDADKDEYGRLGRETAIRFSEPTKRCIEAYHAFTCWVNFPRCDLTRNETLPMCRSSCINMFEICGFPEQMWRCGDSEFFNSMDESELVETSSGNPEKEDQQIKVGVMGEEHRSTIKGTPSTIREGYDFAGKQDTLKRDFFPGQPFKDIECENDDMEECIHKFVCTPSFFGAGERSYHGGARWRLVAVAVAAAAAWMVV